MSKTKTNIIYTGDAMALLKKFDSDSIDAIVTDPPYGISFLELDWDQDVPGIELWQACLRVLKPGGHLLAFASARTYHRMASNIEQAGFEIRDQLMWLYASGFPRSYNIALAIEKKYGPDKANNWQGWGTTLKPAHEPLVMARKPFSGPVIDNVIAFGTGGLNIDASRVHEKGKQKRSGKIIKFKQPKKRFPANVLHNGLDEHWASYFYCPKPTTKERDRGLDKFKLKQAHKRTGFNPKNYTAHRGATGASRNFHPTVKPIMLMEYLITLVTPKGGLVLDPFAGSGTTLIAAKNLGHPYIGIEREANYVKLAKARLAA